MQLYDFCDVYTKRDIAAML